MKITDKKIEELALIKYPKDPGLLGGCSGVKEYDKNSLERKHWIDGFKSALEFISD